MKAVHFRLQRLSQASLTTSALRVGARSNYARQLQVYSTAKTGTAAMSTTTHSDAIIVGSGQCGTPLAPAFAPAGRKPALLERGHNGDTCVNVG